uniref:Uncharacterized protein n=1 Tax=Arundo donax TaxID=35708 RepID=A0A0A9DHE2_ARUDO
MSATQPHQRIWCYYNNGLKL